MEELVTSPELFSRRYVGLVTFWALDFPEKLATGLDVLGNYPAVRRPVQLFRAALQRQGRLGYVVAASTISAMQHLVQDGQIEIDALAKTANGEPWAA